MNLINVGNNEPQPMKLQLNLLITFLVFVYFGPEVWLPFLNKLHIPLVLSLMMVVSCLPYISKIPKGKQNFCLGALLLVSILSIDNSVDMLGTKYALECVLKSFMIYFLMIIILKPRRNLEKCFWITLSFGAIISIGTIVLPKLGFTSGYGIGRYRIVSFFGGIANATNSMAVLMVTLFSLSLCVLEGEKSLFKKIVFVVISLSFAACATRTRSRAAFLGLGVVAGALVYGKNVSGKRKIIFSAMILALFIAFIYFNTHSGYWNRMATISTESEANLQGESHRYTRGRQNVAALKIFKLEPVIGVGIGSYRRAAVYYGFEQEYRNTGQARNIVHNAYLSFLAETGLVGAISFILMIVYSLKDLLYAEKRFSSVKESYLLYKIAKGTRIGLMGFSVCLLFQPEQYNRVLYQLFAFAVVLKNLAFEMNDVH